MKNIIKVMLLSMLIISIASGCRKDTGETKNNNTEIAINENSEKSSNSREELEINIIEKGTFDEVILSLYPQKNFKELELEKRKEDSIEVRENDGAIAQEILSYFRDINIEKISVHEIPEEVPSRELYEIDFIEKDAYSRIKIHVLNKEYLRVLNYVNIKNKDEEKNIISYEEKYGYNYFKILDSEFNLEYIEKIFNSLSEEAN